MKPEKVVVVCGGNSREREVSLKSGRAVFEAVSEVYREVICLECSDATSCLRDIVDIRPDMVFIALHGGYGEDGRLQASLDLFGIGYTGSDARASAICMDKYATKSILHYSGLPVKQGVLVRSIEDLRSVNIFPVCIKPNNEGSSIGVEFADNAKELEEKASVLLKDFGTLLVEKRIFGMEMTVGIVAGKTLPVIHIKPKEGFYDYIHKYTVGATEYIVPADVKSEVRRKCEEVAFKAYRVVGCKGVARVDMILESHTPFILEINTVPGMTETSLLPKAASAVGWSFRDMLVAIIESDG